MRRALVWILGLILLSSYVAAQAFQVGVVVGNFTNQTTHAGGAGGGGSGGSAGIITPAPEVAVVVPLEYDFPTEIWSKPNVARVVTGTITNRDSTPHTITMQVDGTTELVISPTQTTIQPKSALQVTFTYRPTGDQAVSAVVTIREGNTTERRTIALIPDVPPKIEMTVNEANGEYSIQGTVDTKSPVDVHGEIRKVDGTIDRAYETKRVDGKSQVDWKIDLHGLPAGQYQGCLIIESKNGIQENCQPFTITAPENDFPLGGVLGQKPQVLWPILISLIGGGLFVLYRFFFRK